MPDAWVPTFVNGGHECLVVRVWDETSDGLGTPPWDASLNRHVAQRNIHVAAAGQAMPPAPTASTALLPPPLTPLDPARSGRCTASPPGRGGAGGAARDALAAAAHREPAGCSRRRRRRPGAVLLGAPTTDRRRPPSERRRGRQHRSHGDDQQVAHDDGPGARPGRGPRLPGHRQPAGRGVRRLHGGAAGLAAEPVSVARRGGSGRRSPQPARRRRPSAAAMISAAMETAVSSGVRAPRSRPIGRRSRASSSSVSPASRSRVQPVVVGAPGAHRADVGDPGRRSATSSSGTSNLGSWVSTADHGAPVDPAGVRLGLQVAVRPLDDDLVGVREAVRWRRPAGRRRRSRGSRGTRPTRATAAAKSIAPKTSIRGRGANGRDEHPQSPRRGARRRGRSAASRCARRRAGRGRRRAPRRRRAVPSRASPADRGPAPEHHDAAARAGRRRVLDDGGDGDGAAGLDVGRRPRRARGTVAGSIGSTKTSMMPPQVRPTANASSSLTP